MWSQPPWSDQEVERRKAVHHRLQIEALGLDDAGIYDEAGRRILVGYQAVRDFLLGGLAA